LYRLSITDSFCQLKSSCFATELLFTKQTAHSLLLNGLNHVCILSLLLYLNPCIPRRSWLIALTSLLVSTDLVSALIFRRSLPAINGAANIAHKEKCERFCAGVNPFPTSNMSGSFQ